MASESSCESLRVLPLNLSTSSPPALPGSLSSHDVILDVSLARGPRRCQRPFALMQSSLFDAQVREWVPSYSRSRTECGWPGHFTVLLRLQFSHSQRQKLLFRRRARELLSLSLEPTCVCCQIGLVERVSNLVNKTPPNLHRPPCSAARPLVSSYRQ